MKRLFFFAVIVLGFPGFSTADPVTYSGQDDGASDTGPWPNSAAAQSAFIGAAGTFGALNTITFENLSPGYSANFLAAPGVTVTLTGGNAGAGYSGISNSTFGNLYGFNTTPGGSNWLGFPGGSATFGFANPTNSFGMYLTGLQTTFTQSLTVNFTDDTSEVLSVPVNVNGGAQYFGFTDTVPVSSVTITNNSNDAWGVDDITYNVSTTPEPSCIIGACGLGLMGLLGLVWRRRKPA